MDLYFQLAEKTGKSHRGQLQTYMDRRIDQANQYKLLRTAAGTEKMTAADAEKYSLLAVGDAFSKEIRSEWLRGPPDAHEGRRQGH